MIIKKQLKYILKLLKQIFQPLTETLVIYITMERELIKIIKKPKKYILKAALWVTTRPAEI